MFQILYQFTEEHGVHIFRMTVWVQRSAERQKKGSISYHAELSGDL